MAESTLRLEIVTPSGVMLSKDVSELNAPGVAGEFGVLPGHRPLLAALGTGTISYRVDGEVHKAVIAHGFAEVVGDRALVLTEKFARKSDVDVVAVRSRLKQVDEELAMWTQSPTDPARLALVEEEQWLGAELELVGDTPEPTVRENTRFVEKGERERATLYEDSQGNPSGSGADHDEH